MGLSVYVMWDFSYDARGISFRVERKEPADLDFTIIEESVDRPYYIDTTVEYGKFYIYRVTAKSEFEETTPTLTSAYTSFPPPGGVRHLQTCFQETT